MSQPVVFSTSSFAYRRRVNRQRSSLSFVRGVNHGKQSSLFHDGSGQAARAKSVFMLGIMAGRAAAFENIVADLEGSHLESSRQTLLILSSS